MTFETMTSTQFRQRHRELEADFQQWVIDMARLAGLLPFHWPDSRRATEAGWVDLTLLGKGRIIFAELKREGEKRAPAQINVGNELGIVIKRVANLVDIAHVAIGGGCIVEEDWDGEFYYPAPIQYYVWHPTDRPEILRAFGLPQSYLGDAVPVDVEPPMPGLLE